MSFPPGLSKDTRKLMHQIAEGFSLPTASTVSTQAFRDAFEGARPGGGGGG